MNVLQIDGTRCLVRPVTKVMSKKSACLIALLCLLTSGNSFMGISPINSGRSDNKQAVRLGQESLHLYFARLEQDDRDYPSGLPPLPLVPEIAFIFGAGLLVLAGLARRKQVPDQ